MSICSVWALFSESSCFSALDVVSEASPSFAGRSADPSPYDARRARDRPQPRSWLLRLLAAFLRQRGWHDPNMVPSSVSSPSRLTRRVRMIWVAVRREERSGWWASGDLEACRSCMHRRQGTIVVHHQELLRHHGRRASTSADRAKARDWPLPRPCPSFPRHRGRISSITMCSFKSVVCEGYITPSLGYRFHRHQRAGHELPSPPMPRCVW